MAHKTYSAVHVIKTKTTLSESGPNKKGAVHYKHLVNRNTKMINKKDVKAEDQ